MKIYRLAELIEAHLKVLLRQAPTFAQALHDGLIPQNVLLTEVFSSFPWF